MNASDADTIPVVLTVKAYASEAVTSADRFLPTFISEPTILEPLPPKLASDNLI